MIYNSKVLKFMTLIPNTLAIYIAQFFIQV